MAMPTPVEMSSPWMASFSVVALTAAPRIDAEARRVRAAMRTLAALHALDAMVERRRAAVTERTEA